ncbi:MAG TPA: 23S rRNA (guanosine(2251)-2'-O)-methyltransferase RlmB [Bacteroidales bacterium]|nr:23S rRNA (guanosine(2251)-2'-O)-methyltransferase RlmB [Bacteroidales bacterium]HPS17957.1 23S rRNA (guanosine(2251)-2'-O)-methyltransferase RlmB [Bacteroidales bacterium]
MANKDNIIFGIRPVIEAIKSGKEIDRILLQSTLGSHETIRELKQVAREMDIPIQYVPMEKLNKVTFKNHQGVIAYVSEITYQPLQNILPGIYEKGEDPFILILDRITDVRNFGAIARTAECAGVHAIVIPLKGTAQINMDAVKTSAGALYNIPVCREENLKNAIDFMKASGIEIIACSEKGDKTYHSLDYKKPVAIILGSEEDGISPEYLKKSDHSVHIPMTGTTASLNVSVATGIILFEALKQRTAK